MQQSPAERILIVDDDKQLARTISLRLSATGYEVFTAHRAEDASEMAVRERPDVILLDVNMPHFSGIDLHQCLRFASRCRDIPVIYISGESSLSTRRTAFELGATAFIAKPFETNRLVDVVQAVLAQRTQGR